MSESLNFLLLSTFYHIERVEQDMQTLLKRCQALLIIYTNLAILMTMAIRNLYFLIGLSVPTNDVNLTLVGLPILSLICLKRKNLTPAISLVLIYCQVAVYQVCQADETSLCSLTLVQGTAAFVFFLTPRPIFHILNLVLCLIQNVFIVRRISGIFGTTFTEEQSLNIVQNNLASFLYIMIFASVSYTQRSIQENLLQIIQSHSHRTEKISQELVQALKAKDMFVNSLSHEIRNPLNAMKGSIDYLLKTVKSSTQLQVLENASLSSEVLLQLLNNVLDAAKLRSDKIELLYSETNIGAIVKKVMTTQSDRIKEKDMIAEIHIDRKIPKKLWIDSSRLMQVIMNLISNAVKFTPKKGKLSIYASWYSVNEKKDKLLSPFIRSKRKQAPTQGQTDDDRGLQGDSASLRKLSNRKTLTLSDSTMSLAPLEYSIQATSAPFCNMQERIFSPKCMKIIESKSKIEIHNILDNNSPHGRFASPTTAMTDDMFPPDLTPEDPKNKGYLKIQISDNGPGIPEDVLPNLFTMFSQSNKEAASIYGGSGLGLWICKQLCEKMGGDIAIHSQVNKGTSLVFYVMVDNSNIQFANSLSFKSPNIIKKKDVRALVVDDYAYNRDIHKLLLEREGVRVSMACHGKEALEKYIMDGEGYYDFILMDIQMPEMDGFTAFRKMREWEANKNWKKVQVYFVSGNYYNEQELLAELKSHGQMDDYGEVKCLRKPIDVAAITNIVDQFSSLS